MRSGHVNIYGSSATFLTGDYHANYWMQNALRLGAITFVYENQTTAGAFRFDIGNFSPSGNSNRLLAYPLRCLSTAVEGEESVVDLRIYRFTVY